MRQCGREDTRLAADEEDVGANPATDFMAKETEKEIVEKERETTYYVCDKCAGRNHERTQWEEDLNIVAFDASLQQHMTHDGHMAGFDYHVEGEYEYLLCDECMEKAHDYLRDFF